MWWSKYSDAYNSVMTAYKTVQFDVTDGPLYWVDDWHHMLDMGGEL